jgi:uncharacterized protein DUF4279
MRTRHRYTVELRVWGEKLDPNVITSETGLEPCQIRVAGTRKGTRTWSEGLWAFNGGGKSGDFEWDSLEDGLVFVMDRLGDSEKLFAKYAADYDVVWWCGHFQSSFDGGPRLSAGLLKRLGSFGAELFIDNYMRQPHPLH